MPSTITPVALPPLSSVTEVHIEFASETANSPVTVIFSDGSSQRFLVPSDSTFLALAAATGTRKQRLYNVVLPLCGITPQTIT